MKQEDFTKRLLGRNLSETIKKRENLLSFFEDDGTFFAKFEFDGEKYQSDFGYIKLMTLIEVINGKSLGLIFEKEGI